MNAVSFVGYLLSTCKHLNIAGAKVSLAAITINYVVPADKQSTFGIEDVNHNISQTFMAVFILWDTTYR